jgi:2-keto-myo-inositol isomerase
MWHASEYINEHGIEATAKLIADNGLTCVGATGIGMSAFGDDEAKQGVLDGVKQYGERMQAFGCKAVVVGCDGPGDSDRQNFSDRLDVMAEHVRKVGETAEPYGIDIALEVNWCCMCRSFRTAGEVARRVNRDNVGVVWDPAHFVSGPSRLSDLDDLKGMIKHAHTNDITGDAFWEHMQINEDRVIPGDGCLPLVEWSDRVTATGYDGWHCVELFNAELWEEDLDTICTRVMEGCKSLWPDAEF